LAKELLLLLPPPSLLIPSPGFACLTAKDKLQAFRRPHLRHLNRALTEGEESILENSPFFLLLSSF
jgi:hypothetical protein